MWLRIVINQVSRDIAWLESGKEEENEKVGLTFNDLNISATSNSHHNHPHNLHQSLVSIAGIKMEEGYLPHIMMNIVAGKRWQTWSTQKEDWHYHPFGPIKLPSAEVVTSLLKRPIRIAVNLTKYLKICIPLKRPGGGNLSVIEEEEGKGRGSSSTGNLPQNVHDNGNW